MPSLPSKARGPPAFWWQCALVGLAGFFQQLDISHGRPRDECATGALFFGIFGVFIDGFYGESTGVVADQPSVEAPPSGEPHGYSLSVPLLRQVPGHRTSPVRLHPPSILPPYGPARPGGRQAPSSSLQARHPGADGRPG